MWKKIGYGGLILILIYFIYAVFFKKIPTPLEQMQKDMKAKKDYITWKKNKHT